MGKWCEPLGLACGVWVVDEVVFEIGKQGLGSTLPLGKATEHEELHINLALGVVEDTEDDGSLE